MSTNLRAVLPRGFSGAFVPLFTLIILTSCAKQATEPAAVHEEPAKEYVETPSSTVESMVSQIGSFASVSEGSIVLEGDAILADMSADTAPAPARPEACSADKNRPTSCIGGSIVSAWNGCINRFYLTLAGGATDHYSVTATGLAVSDKDCKNILIAGGMVPDGDTMTRVLPSVSLHFGEAWSKNPLYGSTMTVDSAPQAAWDGSIFKDAALGTVIARTGLNRQVTINGIHEVLKSASGKQVFDYTHQANLTVSGSLNRGTRTIAVGSSATTWNNSAKFKAIHTFGKDPKGNPVGWTLGRCCYPTEGQITTVYSGSLTGTTTLTFTSCGRADFEGLDGKTIAVNLSRCL